MGGWLSTITQKTGAVLVASLAFIGGIFTQPKVMTVVPPDFQTNREVAIVSRLAPFSPAAPTAQTSSSSLPRIAPSPIAPGLLPKVTSLPFKNKAVSKKAVSKEVPKPNPPATAVKTTTTTATTGTATTQLITADWLLEKTDLSFRWRRDGLYEAVLNTKVSDAQNLQWGLAQTVFGGSGAIPQFSVAFGCDPLPTMPEPGAIDLNPAFAVRTAFKCDVSLTPLSGSDRRARSRQFVFQTDPGPLTVTAPSAMNTVLVNDTNHGGFVFTNGDVRPVAITGLTLDVAYMGLSTSTGPLVLRFIDSRTDQALRDYHIENLPSDPSRPFAASDTSIAIPLSFAMEPTNTKLLAVQVLGVHKILISGTRPTITLAVRGVNTAEKDIKTVLGGAQISWSCVVTNTPYNPNATSGAFAAGDACRN